MKRVLAAVLMVLAVTGCGYTTGSLLPSHYKTIFVKAVENKTDYVNQDERRLYVPGLENRVRTAVIDRFAFDGNLRTGEETAADLVLETRLISFDREELRLTTADNVQEYRLRVTVAIRMIDHSDNDKVMWEEPSFSGEATYYITGALAKSESTAIDDTLKDLAQRVVERTVQSW